MSNYPPPPPYGGPYFAHPGQLPYQAQPPPGSGYPVNYPLQYLQQTNAQQGYHPGQGPLNPQQFPNNTTFGQNQYQPIIPQHAPGGFFNYTQYSANNNTHPYSPSHMQTPNRSAFAPSDYGAAPSQYAPTSALAPQHDAQVPGYASATSVAPANSAVRSLPHGSTILDPTDEAIRQALAAVQSNPASIPTSQSEATSDPSFARHDAKIVTGLSGLPQNLEQSTVPPPLRSTYEGKSPRTSKAQPLLALPGLQAPQSSPPQEPSSKEREEPGKTVEVSQAIWQDKRNEAEEAVKELMNGGISIDQISGEGVDIQILQQLCNRPGGLLMANAHSLVVANSRSTRSLESGEVSEGQSSSEARASNGVATNVASPGVSDLANTATVNSHPPIVPKPISKPEERKDILKRAFAQHESKTKEPNKGSAKLDSLQKAKATDSKSSEANIEPGSLMMETAKSPGRPKAKDPGLTELARKKMEALKAKNRPHPIATSSDISQIPSTQKDLNMANLDGLSRDDVVVPASTSRSDSFYADGDTQLFTGLPGLSPVIFMPPQGAARLGNSNSDASRNQAEPPLHPPINPPTRKRATASDFINSPPPSKRRMGSDGPIEVVIDVSEDEDGEIKDDDLEGDVQPGSRELPSHLRGRPPISHLASAESIGSPRDGLVQTPNLTELEAQMKAMKEKIAERERYKRALKAQEATGSGGGSTDASNSGIASPGHVVAAGMRDLNSSELKAKQQRALATSRTLLLEKLEAERRTHALLTAHAEIETRQAANATTTAERDKRLDRKAVLEASIPKLDSSISATIHRLETIRKEQDDIEKELERDRQERQALIEELKILLASEHSPLPLETTSTREGARMLIPQVNNLDKIGLETSSGLHHQNDSEPQSSADLPEYNRQSPDTVSSRADGAENLLEAAMDISGASDGTPSLSSQDQSEMESFFDKKPVDSRIFQLRGEGNTTTDRSSRDETDADTPDDYGLSLDETFSDDDDRDDIEADNEITGQDIYLESSKMTSHSSEAELEEQSAVEELAATTGELVSPESSHGLSAPDVRIGEGSIGAEGNILPPHKLSHSSSTVEDRLSEEGEISGDEQSSDDYEPPEPAAERVRRHSEDQELPLTISQNGPFASPSRDQEKPQHSHIVGSEENLQAVSTEHAEAHFQPYESPLAKLKSYRLHPQYVANVSGGFRSLTFNHQIRADVPLCRWETTGGVCNDEACELQHFRDLTLSDAALISSLYTLELTLIDDALLHQLSATMEANSSAASEILETDLRKFVASLHAAGVCDIESVASHLVASRARSLADPISVDDLSAGEGDVP